MALFLNNSLFQVPIVVLVVASRLFRKSLTTESLMETKWLIFVLQITHSTYFGSRKGMGWLNTSHLQSQHLGDRKKDAMIVFKASLSYMQRLSLEKNDNKIKKTRPKKPD